MSGVQIPHLVPPSVTRRAPWQDSQELRVSNWLTPWQPGEEIDAGLLGLPYSGASISPGSAAGGPEAIRLAFRSNTTYSADFEVDIQDLCVRDLGDVGGHLTDVQRAHQNIEEAVGSVACLDPRFIPIMLGGDHSVTAPAVRGFAAAHAGQKLGLINFDAHHDVRNLDNGPHNGTPFRQIIEGGQVAGRNLVEIGIHGFMNSARYDAWLKEQGGTVISARQVQKTGMDACIGEALAIAAADTDVIYVSVDIDCLGYPWAPGTSASSAEGLSAWQLLEGAFACGQHPKVAAFDLVEVDPSRDVQNLTARTACSTILTFLAGLATRASRTEESRDE